MQRSEPEPTPRRLPRGRHALSRAEVERVHRDRLCGAMAQAMAEKGFVGTSVEDVLKRARVSRQSFYALFTSKLDCFMAAFDQAGLLLYLQLEEAMQGEGDAPGQGPAQGEGDAGERFERVMTAYLEALAAEPAYARLFLVEVFAAGPEAVRRRTRVQRDLAASLADLMGVTGDAGRFACEVIVAAVSSMVTPAIAAGDMEALRAIRAPVIEHVRLLLRSGVMDG
ncbi:AcrR family transcriptional regulator [Actinomadura luteofluorescens]|uniref:AcrR family transcriptional regulator n=1 Tax=Actinomadura luteofluorescens TaxID=46163 RepID=A0A7Y9JH92_9ACTN|nr:TetR/AcrR family transcriptional regulator [Actinomadura luteofluorescens]NYD48486.1 AcrR family transcriptional regulator [Actinomadura luteofluorescens]